MRVRAGAALSIEGAYLLGSQLSARDCGASHPTTLAELQAAFAAYQAAHQDRVAQCRTVTAFTELLGLPASAPTEALRNAMRFVPQVNDYDITI